MLLLQITSPAAATVAATIDTAVKAASNTLAVATPAAATEDSFTLLSMIMKGGPMMVPMGILLLLSIYVLIERLISIGKASRKNSGLLGSLQGLIKQGNLSSAQAMCAGQATPEGFMLEKGISRVGQPVIEMLFKNRV